MSQPSAGITSTGKPPCQSETLSLIILRDVKVYQQAASNRNTQNLNFCCPFMLSSDAERTSIR